MPAKRDPSGGFGDGQERILRRPATSQTSECDGLRLRAPPLAPRPRRPVPPGGPSGGRWVLCLRCLRKKTRTSTGRRHRGPVPRSGINGREQEDPAHGFVDRRLGDRHDDLAAVGLQHGPDREGNGRRGPSPSSGLGPGAASAGARPATSGRPASDPGRRGHTASPRGSASRSSSGDTASDAPGDTAADASCDSASNSSPGDTAAE